MIADPLQVPTVIKVGGSVLRGEEDFQSIAERLRPWLQAGAWVVVSAARGVTDQLGRLAKDPDLTVAHDLLSRHARWAGEPLPATVARELPSAVLEPSRHAATILSWGERASAAALGARLSQIGIRAPIAELPSRGPPPNARAAIVPGFYIRDAAGRIHLLPRGGSDISAVLLATRIHAREVRFWKDGGGIHVPAEPASTVPELYGSDLLAQLGDRIRPLHPAALRLALRAGLDLVLEDPSGQFPSTRVRNPSLVPDVSETRGLRELLPEPVAVETPWRRG